MKKFILLLAAIALVSCSSEEPEAMIPDSNDDTEEVTLSFHPYTMKAMSRATTRGTSITDLSKLDIYLILGTDTIAVHQSKSDEGFGTVSVRLKKKEYKILALGYIGTREMYLNNNVVTFENNKIQESYIYKGTINPTEATSKTCKMTQMVSWFVLEAKDLESKPEDADSLRFTITNSGIDYDIATGFSNTLRERTTRFSLNTTSAYFNIYMFLPAETSKVTINMKVISTNGEVLNEHTFSDVDYQIGAASIFRGNIFSLTSDFTFTLATWQTLSDNEF